MEFINFFTDINLTWITVVCFIFGFGLVIFEMFYPGFGAPGIIGGILLLLGVIFATDTILQIIVMLIIVLAILGIVLTLVLHSATHGRLSKTVILNDSVGNEEGYVGTEDLKFFLGKEGSTVTVLRPAGMASFDGLKLDVVSQGEFIASGTKVKIVKIEGSRIVVQEVK